MRAFYVISIIVCVVIGGTSCNKNKEFSGMVEPLIVEKGHLIVLNDSSLWSFPLQMEVIDTFLIVLDEYDGHFFSVFSTNGKPLMNFGNKGQGPGELLWANKFHLSVERKLMYVYDDMSKKIVAYNLDSVFFKRNTFEEYYIDRKKIPYSKVPTIIYDMLPLNESEFLVKGNHSDLRYGIYNIKNKGIVSIYNSYLDDSLSFVSQEEAWSLLSSNTFTKFSPNKDKMVNATYIGGIMEIFSMGRYKKKLRLNRCSFIYEPIYRVVEGTMPPYVVNNERTQFGFEDVCVTDKLIYTLLHSEGDPHEPDFIMVFDWDGNAVKRIEVGKRIAKFSIDDAEKRMYLLVLNEDNGYELDVMSLDVSIKD